MLPPGGEASPRSPRSLGTTRCRRSRRQQLRMDAAAGITMPSPSSPRLASLFCRQPSRQAQPSRRRFFYFVRLDNRCTGHAASGVSTTQIRSCSTAAGARCTTCSRRHQPLGTRTRPPGCSTSTTSSSPSAPLRPETRTTMSSCRLRSETTTRTATSLSPTCRLRR